MDVWIIGLVAGALILVALVVLLGVVVKSATATAQTAQAVLEALEDIKATTAPLARLSPLDLEALGEHRGKAGNGADGGRTGTAAEEQRGKEG